MFFSSFPVSYFTTFWTVKKVHIHIDFYQLNFIDIFYILYLRGEGLGTDAWCCPSLFPLTSNEGTGKNVLKNPYQKSVFFNIVVKCFLGYAVIMKIFNK